MEKENESANKIFKMCKGSIQILKNLVEDFIDFTRFENQSKVTINKKFVNLKELFEIVKNMFEIQAEEKVINLFISSPFLFYFCNTFLYKFW